MKDFFLSYSAKNMIFARQLKDYLESKKISVWFAPDDIPIGSNYMDSIASAIRDCDGMIVLLSEDSMESAWVYREVQYAFTCAEDRNKRIISIVLDNAKLTDDFVFPLSDIQMIYANTVDPSWPEKALKPILQMKSHINEKAQKYEEFSELKKSFLYLEASEKLTEIIEIIIEQIDPQSSLRSQHELIIELNQCLEQLHSLYEHCEGDYSQKAREVTQSKLNAINRIKDMMMIFPHDNKDLFYICCRIRFLYWDREIRWDCADMITHGDVSEGIVKTLPESEYAEKQEEYRVIYTNAAKEPVPGQPKAITEFIRHTETYLYEQPATPKNQRAISTQAPSQDDEKLQAIAGYIREGNRIFEMIGQDEKAAAFLKCLITSYERLKNYCEEIGAREMTSECISRIASLKQQYMRFSDEDSKDHTKAEKGIRALLGFSRPGIGTYDIFLSHKSYDLDIAQDVYRFLKSNMREVFLDKISLPELSRAEYKDAILQALDKSKHFVVIISDVHLLEHLDHIDENDWVQREMDLFHSEIFEGRNKEGNFVILVTDNVFDEIKKHNKKNMDIKWRSYNLIRIREYKDQIMSYLA